jgi:hypothetical protein
MTVYLDEKELAELRRCHFEWQGKTLTVNVCPQSLVIREPGPPPPMFFLVVTDKLGEDEEGGITGDMHMVGYACMELLPKELRMKIRDILLPVTKNTEVEVVTRITRTPAEATTIIHVPITEDGLRCADCGGELARVQHPMKPLGVVIGSYCPNCHDAALERDATNARLTVTKKPLPTDPRQLLLEFRAWWQPRAGGLLYCPNEQDIVDFLATRMP